MSKVRPFKGLRPRPEHAAEVAAPPYDVLSSDEARNLARNNPNSFLRVNKSEIDFPPGSDPYSHEVYTRGRQNLHRLISEGIMIQDARPCFYVYRLTWQGRSQSGLVCLSSIEEYQAGLIKKHEHTRPEKVQDRADHIQALNAQVGPVFLTVRHLKEIDQLLNKVCQRKPICAFTAPDDVQHELWLVGEQTTIDDFQAAFGQAKATYIADGHHRAASAAEVAGRMKKANPNNTTEELYDYFLTVIFPDDQVRILPYNRVVKDLNGLTPAELIDRASALSLIHI